MWRKQYINHIAEHLRQEDDSDYCYVLTLLCLDGFQVLLMVEELLNTAPGEEELWLNRLALCLRLSRNLLKVFKQMDVGEADLDSVVFDQFKEHRDRCVCFLF